MRHSHYGWKKLDNAAKIFPSNSNLRDTKVFRLSCELFENVDCQTLQSALNNTIIAFPHFNYILRKGLFWYFLEESALKPVVFEESLPLCCPLYDPDRLTLLYRTMYYKKRISIEVYHSITDGTGAMQFFRTLIYHYLTLAHPKIQGASLTDLDYDASLAQKMDDSFEKYYQKNTGASAHVPATPSAYKIVGQRLPDYMLKTVEIYTPVKQVSAQAKKHGVSITVFIASLLILAIGNDMNQRAKKLPVVLSIPVNLRTYFESQSARNFFGVFYSSYNFASQGSELEDIIAKVASDFKEELTPQKLSVRMNSIAGLEHNMFARAIPLFIKNITLKIYGRRTEKRVTAAFSNVGIISMPNELEGYINNFSIMASTNKLQTCISSYGGNLCIAITDPFISTNIELDLVRHLTNLGIDVTVDSNTGYKGEHDEILPDVQS